MPPNDETFELIASDKVEGTDVYGTDGEKIGTIIHVMIDKRSGHVEYAVFQPDGAGDTRPEVYPVPWMALEYDEEQAGYVIDVEQDVLEAAPKYPADSPADFTSEYIAEIDAAYDIEHHEHPHPHLPGAAEFVRHNPVSAVLGAVLFGVVLSRIGIL